jgi:neutral ceramidase
MQAPGLGGDMKNAAVRTAILLFGVGVISVAIALTSVNAEVYTLISQRMKKQSPMANTVMVTLANGRANSGYLPHDAAFGACTFQVLGSRLKPGCAEQGIASGLADLIGQYTAK